MNTLCNELATDRVTTKKVGYQCNQEIYGKGTIDIDGNSVPVRAFGENG